MIRADRSAPRKLLGAASGVPPVEFVNRPPDSPIEAVALSRLKAVIVHRTAHPPIQRVATSIYAINVITRFRGEIRRVVTTSQQLRNWSQVSFTFPRLFDRRFAVANNHPDFRFRAVRAHPNVAVTTADGIRGPEVTALVRGNSNDLDFRSSVHDCLRSRVRSRFSLGKTPNDEETHEVAFVTRVSFAVVSSTIGPVVCRRRRGRRRLRFPVFSHKPRS